MADTAQWAHDPNHPTAAEHTVMVVAQNAGPTCFDCWCYACGGRTDQPRLMAGADLRDGLTDPNNHRWCFE